MKIFRLMQDHLGLAQKEVLALTGDTAPQLFQEILICRTRKDLSGRLGLAHSIYSLIDICEEADLQRSFRKVDWDSLCEGGYCVRTSPGKHEQRIADQIYGLQKNPKVDLASPKAKIEFFFRSGKVIIGLLESVVDKSYLARKAHLRPEMHPTSMHPGLARACINLAGLCKGKIIDPFCGSGGFLIEAALMGFEVIGYDIDAKQLERAEKNLSFYRLKKYSLAKWDSSKLNAKCDAIVTDLPYGRSSKVTDIENLYSDFLNAASGCTSNLVVVMPDSVDYRSILSRSPWQIKEEEKIYVHKSLSRIIFRLIPAACSHA